MSKKPEKSTTATDGIIKITDMDELIAYAYLIFSNYRPHRPLEVCTYCCMCEKNVELIYKMPVQKLSREVIYDYLDAAQGDSESRLSDEIRYFAPRIFELLAKGEHIRHSLEYTLDKFHLDTGVWSKTEVAVFKRFSELFLVQELSKTYERFCYQEIFDCLVMFYNSGLDNTQELLGILMQYLDNENVLLNLCKEFYYSFKDDYYQNCTSPQFNQLIYDWEHKPKNRQIILQKLLAFTQSDMYQTLDEEKRYWVDLAFDRFCD